MARNDKSKAQKHMLEHNYKLWTVQFMILGQSNEEPEFEYMRPKEHKDDKLEADNKGPSKELEDEPNEKNVEPNEQWSDQQMARNLGFIMKP